MFDRRQLMRCCSVAILALGFAMCAGAADRIDLAAFEYPPIYQNSSGKGVAGDLAVAAFKAVDVDADLMFFPAARMIHYVGTGQATCAIGGRVLFEDPKVASGVRIGSVILFVTQTFLYDRRRFPDGIRYAELAQLKDYRIGALHSSGIMKILQKVPGLNLEANTTHDGSARQLYLGRIDLWAIVDLTGHFYMNSLFPGDADRFERTASFNRGDVSLVCSRQRDPDGAYTKKFAEGLARIKKNGTYMQIMAKYYGGMKRINPEALTDDMRQ